METRHEIWQAWNRHLEKWGLQNFTAWLLEAFKPVNFLVAQLVYIGQPFLVLVAPRDHTDTLARLLEEPEEMHAFIHFLRQERSI